MNPPQSKNTREGWGEGGEGERGEGEGEWQGRGRGRGEKGLVSARPSQYRLNLAVAEGFNYSTAARTESGPAWE